MMHEEASTVLDPFGVADVIIVLLAITLLYASFIQFIFAKYKYKLSGRRLPPGPTPWPLLGNIPSIILQPQESMVRLARIYGPVMSFQLGMKPAVIISSAATAKDVLQTYDGIFGYRPSSTLVETASPQNGAAFNASQEQWKNFRKLLVAEMAGPKRLESAQGKGGRAEEMLLALQALVETAERSRNCGEDFSQVLSKYIIQIVGNVTTRMLFGQRLFLPSDPHGLHNDDFASGVIDTFQVLTQYDVRDAFPFLKSFDLQGYSKRLLMATERIDRMLGPLFDARREKLRAGTRTHEDMLDELFLIEAMGKQPMTDVNKKDMIMAATMAGPGATASTLDWAMSELLRKPAYLKRCQEQLDAVVGRDRLVSESDLPHLPYVRAILLETMRLHPTAGFLGRQSISDCEVGGVFIPANTMTLVNVKAIHMDPTTWPNPKEFIPDRHVKSEDGDVHMNTQDFTIIGFGAGRRSCPGRKMGWLMSQMVLATFLHAFDFDLPANIRPEELDMTSKWSLEGARVEPLRLIPTLRIPRTLIIPETLGSCA